MKANKIFSLDVEMITALKEEDNASALVNRLLKEHYDKDRLDNMSREELDKELRALHILKEAEEMAKEVRNGNR